MWCCTELDRDIESIYIQWCITRLKNTESYACMWLFCCQKTVIKSFSVTNPVPTFVQVKQRNKHNRIYDSLPKNRCRETNGLRRWFCNSPRIRNKRSGFCEQMMRHLCLALHPWNIQTNLRMFLPNGIYKFPSIHFFF